MPTESKSDLYRKLPSVDELLRRSSLSNLVAKEGQVAVRDAARAILSSLRSEIEAGNLDSKTLELAVEQIDAAVDRQVRRDLRYSLRSVINATGVILHTNLGRAPLSNAILDHIAGTSLSYSNLEFDLETGQRGKRDIHVDRLFRKVLEIVDRLVRDSSNQAYAEISTIVVNNNAAAVLLALNTLAEGGEVIVSRGELVEIGGSFRIPDVMAKSNAVLREVGTTNRTRIQDYERAISEKTRLLLRVHRSNFQITGFTEQPELDELVQLSRKRKIPLMEDLGSGALFDLRSVGVTGEPTVLDSLQAGVDLVTYSGDKLLGGPQAGMLSGRADLIARMRSNSLFRALRVDKLTYAALEATLMAYVKSDHDAIPAVRMMRLSKQQIANRAETIVSAARSPKLVLELVDGESLIGGGAAPSASLPTCLIAVSLSHKDADEISKRLRAADPPVVARVDEGRVLLDLRTVFPEHDNSLIRALQHIASD
ncbi:MAG TPA: L-seryl-tRNA(Sec) selenium transferase [Terriglobales bacterium]|nr:L-seryl-tRNA(Sec) selenium transferase [Terriglobales bacterium]